MSVKTYQACVKDKQKSLLNPKSCENAMAEAGAVFPCSTLCPCHLRDAYIALYESHTKEKPCDGDT